MKKLILGAVFAVSAMFMACSDDSSSGSSAVNSCDVNATLGVPLHVCIESSDMPNAETMCKVELAEKISALSGTTAFGSGCASGAKKTCPITTEDGVHLNIYIYDDVLSTQECEDLMAFVQ